MKMNRFTLFFLLNTLCFSTSICSKEIIDLSLEQILELDITSVSFFEENKFTAASTVHVLKPKDWQRLGSRRTLDVVGYQAGTLVAPSIYGNSVVSIRGYTQVASSRGIATLLDGIPTNGVRLGSGQYITQNIQLGILDRIEVIRGPGSAIYGSDAFHGVIAMTTFESEKDTTNITAEGGTKNYYQTAFQHSAGFENGARVNLAFSASGEKHNRTLIGQPIGTEVLKVKTKETEESQTISLKTTLRPSSTFKILSSLYFDNYDTNDYPGSLISVTDTDWSSKTLAAQVTMEKSFDSGRSFETRFYHISNHTDRSLVASTLVKGDFQSFASSKENRSGILLTLRQPFINGNNTRFAFGVGHESSHFQDGLIEDFPLDGSPVIISKFGTEGEKRKVGHILLDAKTILPNKKWSLNYGGRLDKYSKADIQSTPRLGLIYQNNKNTAYKLLYNNAFRAPKLGELTDSSDDELKPETLDSYELVIVKQYEAFSAEIIFFENHWKDGIKIVLDSSKPRGFKYRNEGKNSSHGIETSLSWNSNLYKIDVSGSYIESRNDETKKGHELFPRFIANIGFTRYLGNGSEISINNRIQDQVKDISSAVGSYKPETLPTYWRTDLNFKTALSSNKDLFINILNFFNVDNRNPSVLLNPKGIPDDAFKISSGIRMRW